MKLNLIVLGIFLLCVVVLFIYLVRKNIKDENELEDSFNDSKQMVNPVYWLFFLSFKFGFHLCDKPC